MGRPIKRLQAEPGVIAELRRRSRSTTIGMRDRERANIILLRTEGLGVEAVAERLSTTSKRVSMWSTRFARSGLNGLADEPGRGRKASISAAKVARVITEATRPPPGRSRWSIRSMARHAGVLRLAGGRCGDSCQNQPRSRSTGQGRSRMSSCTAIESQDTSAGN